MPSKSLAMHGSIFDESQGVIVNTIISIEGVGPYSPDGLEANLIGWPQFRLRQGE